MILSLDCTFFFAELTFITPPQNVSVDVGKAVSVFANVRNASNVYWCKGKDQVIRISSTFRQQFDESNQKAELTLSNARLQDDGEYTCVAEKYGRNKKEIKESFFIYVHHGCIFYFYYLPFSRFIIEY